MTTITLRDYQDDAVQEIRQKIIERLSPALLVMPTGSGKCLGKGTPILMFDGTIKPVEDVRVGDLLIGPDSRPRCVLSLARGREMLYRVTPTKGDPYVVNESHILSLKRTSTHRRPSYPCQARGGETINIGVLDYLRSSKTFKHIHKGWRAPANFSAPTEPALIDPYFLGIWLGDGHSHVAEITTCDEEIAQYVVDYATKLGMRTIWRDNSELSIGIRIVGESHAGRGGTPIMNHLREYDLIRNKHIPHRYKTGSREERLQVLAGLIDTDGYYSRKGYDITLKSERLMDDLIFVARSLGFAAYKSASRKTCGNNGVTGDYWRCSISGDVDEIPCRLPRKQAAPRQQKKDPRVTGIQVEAIGEGNYYGFEIDGDRLFMLGDFTVTHNTYTFSFVAAAAAEKGRRVIIIVHRKELLLQASGSLRALGIEHGMISPHFTPNPHALIQVASVDTLLIRIKKQPGNYRFDIAIFDEAHHVIADNKWGRAWEELGRPLMLGVTATPVRTDGKGLGEHSAGVFKSMVLGPCVSDLIAWGKLINPVVYTSLEMPDLSGLKKDKDGDYNRLALAERVDKPRITGSAVEHYTKICPGAKTVVFCSSIAHAKHVRDEFNAAGYKFDLLCGAPEMSDSERSAVNRRLRRGEIHGACTVDLVSEGYDLPDLECCIMLRPTASEALYLQQIGRIMRPSPTKKGCWLLDCVGNVGSMVGGEFKVKHGLPDQERAWTLDGRKKKRRKKEEDDDVTVDLKQCPKCYIVHAPAPKCPACGHEYPAGGRGGLEQVDGDLQQITPEMQARLSHDARLKQGRAKTVDEMVQQLGYSPERAAKILQARAEKDVLMNALISDLQAWRQETGQTALDILGVPMMGIKSQKPKALKDLRQRFDNHRAAYATGQGLTGSNTSGTSALF